MFFIETEEEFNDLALAISSSPDTLFADIETTGLSWIDDEILLFQVKYRDSIYIMDIRKLGYTCLENFLKQTKEMLYVFHNAKFDIKFLAKRTGILLENLYDTMIMEALLCSGIGKPFYSLEELTEKYTDVFMDKKVRLEFVNYPKDKPFTESMLNYSALDVMVLDSIFENQIEKIRNTHQSAVAQLENSIIPIVAKMEMTGIRLDVKAWLKVEAEAIELREKLNSELKNTIVDFLLTLKVENGFELARKALIPVTTKKLIRFLEDIKNSQDMREWLLEKFNTKSAHQMKAVLNLMKIKVKNTNEKTLQDYIKYPIIKLLLEIREVNKKIDSYGSNILSHIHPDTGKIHTDYNTIGTVTGRFSSNNPNMQQIPRKGGYRECFIPDNEYLFAIVDYSQQEYRLAGAVSRDSVITKAYQEGSDMHTATAQSQYGRSNITKEERDIGKTINFAILYGSTEFGLKRNLNISVDEAKETIKKFWEGYPKLSRFMEIAGERILELGFSSTPLGRRRYNVPKPLFANSNEFIRWKERTLREGRNHIIQGGGADILKLAMLEISRRNPFGDKLMLLLQVHDELVSMVHISIAEEALKFIVDIMEEVESKFLGAIPPKADGSLKEKWSK